MPSETTGVPNTIALPPAASMACWTRSPSARIWSLQGEGEAVLAAIDARMAEVYAACFRRDADGLVSPVGDEGLFAPAAVPLPATAVQGVGTGFGSYNFV